MRVTATESFVGPRAIAASPAPTSSQLLTDETQFEIQHLTQSLFFDGNGLQRRCVLMAEIGEAPASSLWLAAGVGSALGNILGEQVHVLSLGDESAGDKSSSNKSNITQSLEGCIVERVTTVWSANRDGRGVLQDRLGAIGNSSPVIIHVPGIAEIERLLTWIGNVDGVVLLVRAARTHRVKLDAVVRQLSERGITLLGSVLLDRVYPIPEMLYRLL